MTTWDVYDNSGRWLGTANGFSESEAISHAQASGMSAAVTAEVCEE